MEEPTEVCKHCTGWGEVCSLDWYADYCDPNAGENCGGYEKLEEYKIEYTTYNNTDFKQVRFFKTKAKAEEVKASLEKMAHITEVIMTFIES